MTSGRALLATTGLQDVFLTGDPDLTYFEQVYKRHSKFSLETLDNVFHNQNVDFGNTIRATVERRGDLVRNIYFRIELPELTAGVGYTDSIGNALVEYADLIIGGQLIQRINGEYMEFYDQMFIDESQQVGITATVGTTGTRTGLGPAVSPVYPRTFFMNLPFYFRRNDSLSIPLCAITRQEIEVEIKLRPLSELVVQTAPGVPPTQTASVLKATLPVEYVFLQDDEINYYKSKRIEHTITQIQLQSDTIEKDTIDKQMRLNFINPVKEIFIVIQNQSNVAPDQNDLFNYQNDLLATQLDFNNEMYLDPEVADSLFMYALQAMNRHTRVPNRYIYSYSFALDPENFRPTGQVNMSRIQNKLLTLKVPTSSQSREVRVYARSYNILRIENGLAGVLFIDNNTY
jgi:hypothetical protein